MAPTTIQNIKAVYDSIHPSVVVDYQKRFKEGIISRKKIDPILDRKAYDAANQLNITLSEGFCSLIDVVTLLAGARIPTAGKLPKLGGEILFAATCPEILNSVFPQLSMSLKEAGAYVDMQNLEIALDGYLRKSIAEIATVQQNYDSIHTSKRIERKLFEDSEWYREWIGDKFDSHAIIEINTSAVVKAGIAIDDYFQYQVFPDQAMITIKVPDPEVLSKEIFPHFTKVEDGFLVEINEAILNDAKNCLLYTSPSPRDRTRSRMPSSA